MSQRYLNIQTADNGYVLTTIYEDEQDVTVVEEQYNEENSDIQSLRTLLWHVLDWSGVSNSKHAPYRIQINIVDTEGKIVEDY